MTEIMECRVGLNAYAVQLDDPGAIRQQALGVNSVFTRIHWRAVAVQGIWQGLGPHYVAPEQGLVLAAMTTPVNEAETLSDKSVRVRTALDTFADRLESLRGRRTELAGKISQFYEDKARIDAENAENHLGNDIWDAITGEAERLYHRETALNEQIAALQADKDAAERECANAIGDIWGAPRYSAAGETWVTDEYVYGMNAKGYVALSEAGDAPWGVATMWSSPNLLVKTTMVLEGAGEAVTGTVDFVVSLTGLNGAGQAKAAYSGTGMLLWNGFIATAPVAYLFTSEEERAAARSSLVEVGKGMIGWDTWDTTGYKTAGGLGLDALLTVGTGGAALGARGAVRTAGAAARVGGTTRLASILPGGARLDLRGLAATTKVRINAGLAGVSTSIRGVASRASAALDDVAAALGGPRLAMATPGGGFTPSGRSGTGAGTVHNPTRAAWDAATMPMQRGDSPGGGSTSAVGVLDGPGPGGPSTGGGVHAPDSGPPRGGDGVDPRLGETGDLNGIVRDAPDGGPTHDRYGRQYSFDETGRRHVDGDPDRTYRDANGSLHEQDGGKFASDPNRPNLTDRVVAEHSAVDKPLADSIAKADDYRHLVAERNAARDAHTEALQTRNTLAEAHGIKPGDLRGDQGAKLVQDLVDGGDLTRSEAKRLTDAVLDEKSTLGVLRARSEGLGGEATRALMDARGETVLIDPARTGDLLSAAPRGSQVGKFDAASLRTGEPPTLRLYEAKGGTSSLGQRTIDGVRHQQGSTAYLREIATTDPRVVESLRTYLTRADADPATAAAIRNGTLKVEYDLVRALPGGSVKVSRFKLDLADLRDVPGLSDLLVGSVP